MAKDVILLSAPKYSDPYYKEHYEKIILFQKELGKEILKNDKLLILADKKGLEYFSKYFPKENLLLFEAEDIWLRDPLPIKFNQQYIQFRYAASAQGGSQEDADYTQKKLNPLLQRLNIKIKKSNYILDGGNLIQTKDKLVVTDRFLKDNKLTYAQGKSILSQLSGYSKVAIIPNDDPDGLAHVDGMAAFLDEKTILLNQYQGNFRKRVINELTLSFPGIKIIEVPVKHDKKVWDKKFSSACGINLNILRGKNTLYIPTFASSHDRIVINKIKENTTLKIVEVDARQVCIMGGSVRCLSWNTKTF